MKNHTTIVTVLALALGAAACNDKKEPAPAAPPAKGAPAKAEAQGEPKAAAGAEEAKMEEKAPEAKPEEKAAEAKPAEKPAEAAVAEAVPQPVGGPPAAPAELAPPPDVAAAPADAERTASGLASKVLQAGTGAEKPGPEDTVTVHYTGWMTDGTMFDSSVKRGQPASFPLNRVIAGWTEGLQLMVVGEKRRFWIPANLAYGETPRRPGAPAGMLVFDVELIEFKAAPKVETPENVAAAPADAKKTESGLAYMELQPGSGDGAHPGPTSMVTVHYSGWTTDGKLFDSSVKRGQPASFPLNGVIKGWTEGLQLMTKGQKMRFWIPGALAYGDTPTRPGAPAGTLVFDVELIDFK
jgi:peptidylprolyl isomerase